MPENWKTYNLEDILQIKNGKTKPKNLGDIPIYGGNGILGFGNKSNLAQEAILIGRVGAYCGAVYFENREIWVSDNSLYGIAKTGFDTKFIYYLLKWADLNRYSTGSSQPLLTQGALNGLEFRLPETLKEQKSIAYILSALDDKIELNLQMNKTLEEMAMALYKHWFVDFGPFQDGEFVATELGEIPKGWEVKELREVTTELRRGISPKYTEGEGINVINQRCVRNHLIDFSLTRKHDINKKKVDGRLLELGDVLVNSTGVGTLGRIASVIDLKEDAVVDSHVTVVRANKDSFKLNVFARLMFHIEPVIEAMGEGSTGQTELSRVALGELKVIVPPVHQQRKLEDQLEVFSATIVNNLDNIQTLTQLRDTLLPKLISGEVRVKDVEKTLTEAL